MLDFSHQILDAVEGSAANGNLSDDGDEALDLDEPTTIGPDKVQMPARSARHALVLVRTGVIHDQADILSSRAICIDGTQRATNS